MKICPSCHAEVRDTAKFCGNCRFNIKEYEDTSGKRPRFCTECGAESDGSRYCTECGFDFESETETTLDTDWMDGIDKLADEVEAMREDDRRAAVGRALSCFEYEEHTDGTYSIIGLKDKSLLRVVIPEGVESIGAGVFEGSEVITVTLPDGLLKIGNRAFADCDFLDTVNIPDSLRYVGDEAFAGCESLDITLPAFVRRVGRDALRDTVQDRKRRAEAAEVARKAEAARAEEERKRREEEERLACLRVGGSVSFGSYFRSSGYSKEPIQWTVLARDGMRALLISAEVLAFSGYSDEAVNQPDDCRPATWETSFLRKWLNEEFLRDAFEPQERSRICESRITTSDNNHSDTLRRGITRGGNPTVDRVFLLSLDEAERYFRNDGARRCKPTEYALNSSSGRKWFANPDGEGCSSWWLRSPGVYQNVAANVLGSGKVYYSGHYFCGVLGVRPAMWIEIE